MGVPLRVLVIEDSEDDAALLIHELRRGGYDPSVARVDTEAALRTALAEQTWDIVICDYSLPHFAAPAALKVVREIGLDLPFLIVSGSIGEDTAVEAMKAGAHDCIMKYNLKRLPPAVERELREAEERRNRRKAEEETRRTETYFKLLIENASDIITMLSEDLKIQYASPSAERLLHYERGELIGQSGLQLVHPDDAVKALEVLSRAVKSPGTTHSLELRLRSKEGGWRTFEVLGRYVSIDPARTGVVLSARDNTEHKAAVEALKESEERLRMAINTAQMYTWEWDVPSDRLIRAGRVEEVYGQNSPVSETTFTTFLQQIFPEDREKLRQAIHRALEGRTFCRTDVRLVRADGEIRWLEIQGRAVADDKGHSVRMIGVTQDITERRRAEEALIRSEERFRQIAENIREVFWMTNPEKNEVLYVSPGYERIWGRPCRDLYEHPETWLEAIHPGDRDRVLKAAMEKQSEGTYDEEYRILQPDGSVRWIRDQAFPVRDASGKAYRITGIAEDITVRREAEDMVQHMAFYDMLTGLPNRNTLYNHLFSAITNDPGGRKPMALLLVDLNRFREINDTLGHDRGDELLKRVGRRLRETIFDRDVVARPGGDEFSILVQDLADARDIDVAVRKIEQALNPPFFINNLPIRVEAAIGVALYPEHGQDADTLYRRADIAMQISKKTGGSHTLYDPSRDSRSPQRLALMGELHYAIEHGELLLYYQPKVALKTRRIVGVEALVRWKHPNRGMIPPDQFILPAEQTGLIHPLTQWVLATGMRQCEAWRRAGWPLSVSLNLSARNLLDPKLPEKAAGQIRVANARPEWITLEITESAIMSDPAHALAVLKKLHEMGFELSIDDFGIGYSSLVYLQKLPVDTIKIDKTFVINMIRNQNDAVIVRSTIDLAHNLGLEVIAEGVEDEETWNRLSDLGCDTAQGYHMCKPIPADELDKWMTESPWGMNEMQGRSRG